MVVNTLLPLFSVSKPSTSSFSCFPQLACRTTSEYVSSLGDHIQSTPGNDFVNSFCAPKLQLRNLHLTGQNSVTSIHARSASAEVTEEASEDSIKVVVDTSADQKTTAIEIVAPNWPGILASITDKFKVLELEVIKASVDLKDGNVFYKFCVQDQEGNAIVNVERLKNVEKALRRVLNPALWSDLGKNVNLSHSIGDPETQRRRRLLWLMDQYLKNDVPSIQKSIVDHVEYTIARSRFKFDDFEAYKATANSVRDRLLESWNDNQQFYRDNDSKRVYYLSMEFLMGRSLLNSVFNLGIKGEYAQALSELGYDLEVVVEQERDAALGNGGLGRLAACFMDSLATMNYSAWGYGLRYQYGMFRQQIQDGYQHEQPDYWLNFGNPWEIERVHVTYPVKFYGKVDEDWVDGRKLIKWIPEEEVEAVAYDNPIPGYKTSNTINLRLWAAKPSGEFDLQSFNTGDYVNAILSRQRAETISSVLYPDDRTYQGKELRLKQQYFFVSATLQDIIRRFKDHHSSFEDFPEKVAIQLNDTHPTIGVPEMMRLLVDVESLEWGKAWDITTRVFSVTIHSVLPEMLEKWPIELLQTLLPRHIQIIYKINTIFLEEVKSKFGNDYDRLTRMSIVDEGEKKVIKMASLALVASHTINGVACTHTELLKGSVFKDFYDLWPHKFQNKTNGVTQRRWLAFCNPGLREVLTKWLGTESWITNLKLLTGLRQHADDPSLQKEWNVVRRHNKARLALYIEGISGIKVSIDAMFDVQVKRIHEYKRQLLNVLSIIHRYDCIKNMTPEERKNVVPRVCIIGGKAAPGYEIAKKIIKLVTTIGGRINNDNDVGNLLKVIFIPDYNVSLAELVIPASDLSQHISTVGNEASGTSNMKFAMNGCLLLAARGGSNEEIQQEIGDENIFMFGAKADELGKFRAERRKFNPPRDFHRVIGMIRSGEFGHKEYFQELCDTIDGGDDFYLVGNDFASYLEAQAKVDKTFVDRTRWTKMSIMSTAGSGMFSSDRTTREYAEDIWRIQPVERF